MAFTRKKRRFTKKRRTRKVARRRFKGRGRTTKKRRNPLKKVVMKLKRHPVMDRSSDRDHIVISQKYMGSMAIDYYQGVALSGSATDGFLISMNAMTNTFQSPVTLTSIIYGVPTAKQVPNPTHGMICVGASTGSFNGAVTNNPDGVVTLLSRYQQLCVTSGVFTISLSQDTQGVAASTMGSTRLAVIGLPAPGIQGEFLQYLGNGHWIYPIAIGPAYSTITSDYSSIESLCNDPNSRKTTLTPFAGSKTKATIRYPFSINKYAPPGWWTNNGYFMSGVNGAAGELPGILNQPRILVQIHSDGVQAGQTYRLEMSMKWNVTAFKRNPVQTVI